MANIIFNRARGAVAELVRDAPTAVGVMLLKTAEADGTLADHDTLAALLAGANTECDFTNYARKTGLTGTVTVDDGADTVEVDIPDQTWTAAGGASNNTTVKLVIFVEESASDAGRIPLTAHDWAITTDGSDVTMVVPANGFFGA